ncbi:branched-chain amino acid aminotransferase [Flavisolibacter sp. BT320]|nr:branched-chain amino acid aminotransferase [Flavisolibacter longurius]
MEALMTIPVEKTKSPNLNKVDWTALQFGKYVSDHMFRCTYKNGEWQEERILPFQDISLSPTALVLHYGQSVFEGLKAFRMQDGNINIFRIDKHFERINASLDRMCMPPLPFELFTAAIRQLVQVDAAWIPQGEDVALYIRPLVFASEARFGVKVSDEYTFLVVTGPVPTLYPDSLKVKVERTYIRAAKGGVGFAKCAGNYGGAFYPTQKAKAEGFDQVLWTDAFEHEYFEESGTMNLFFVIDEKVITPPLSDSILDGVTRDSLLTIARSMGYTVEERRISVREVLRALNEGRSVEAFGAGTAAVVAPISVMGVDGELYHLPTYSGRSVMFRLKKGLEAIRTGREEDRWGWNFLV